MKLVAKIKESPHSSPNFFIKKKYSIGIYNGGFKGRWSDLTTKTKTGMLKKQWYIRWSYRDPNTGRMQRQLNIYGGTNEHKNYRGRMQILRTLQRNPENILINGFSPYDDNTNNITPTVFEAIDNALDIKKSHTEHDSFIRFKSDIKKFKKHLKLKGFERRFITSVKKEDVNGFLNDIIKDVSPRSRNNYRTSIGTLWQTMEGNAIVEKNFVKSIPMLKSKPTRNKTFSDNQVDILFNYMNDNCPNLLLFIKFVSYSFLRPIEVCRLTVGSFDLKAKTLTVKTKGQESKTKIIPEILLSELPPLEGYNKDLSLFGSKSLITVWDISDGAKRGQKSREFKKVKDIFNLGKEYGIYSFRHYFITKLYRSFREELSPFETKSKLMLITGHETMKAVEKYLRSIDAELPDDWSEYLK